MSPLGGEMNNFYLNDLSYIFQNRLIRDIQEIRSKMFLLYKKSVLIYCTVQANCVLKDADSEVQIKQRTMISVCQVSLGTFPLARETSRFIDTPEDVRRY